MKSEIIINANDLLTRMPVLDSVIDIRVVDVTDENRERVRAYLKDACGTCGEEANGEIRVAAQPLVKEHYAYGDLQRIIKRLMADDGCPWDKVQTNETLTPSMIEETYEAVDAVKKKDATGMQEEFGDMLMLAIFSGLICQKDGLFTVADVVNGVCKKLVFRHTHVFGADSAANVGDVMNLWEKNKAKEKGYSSAKEKIEHFADFPSLLHAQKALKALKKEGKEVPTKEELERAVENEDYVSALLCICALLNEEKISGETELRARVEEYVSRRV